MSQTIPTQTNYRTVNLVSADQALFTYLTAFNNSGASTTPISITPATGTTTINVNNSASYGPLSSLSFNYTQLSNLTGGVNTIAYINNPANYPLNSLTEVIIDTQAFQFITASTGGLVFTYAGEGSTGAGSSFDVNMTYLHRGS